MRQSRYYHASAIAYAEALIAYAQASAEALIAPAEAAEAYAEAHAVRNARAYVYLAERAYAEAAYTEDLNAKAAGAYLDAEALIAKARDYITLDAAARAAKARADLEARFAGYFNYITRKALSEAFYLDAAKAAKARYECAKATFERP